jgi:hypothetical protein
LFFVAARSGFANAKWVAHQGAVNRWIDWVERRWGCKFLVAAIGANSFHVIAKELVCIVTLIGG